MTEENNTKKTRKASSTADFFAKYKDPRWQKKRLEKMQSAEFRCESCESEDKTLNVHHKSYKKNHNPWEYKDYELECLCEDCHAEKHGIKDRLTAALHDFKVFPYFESPDEELLGFLEGKLTVGVVTIVTPTSYEYLRGYCAAHLLDVDEINKNERLLEIIEADNGHLNPEAFNWAFFEWSISKMQADYMQKRITNGDYSHYPDWFIEKILKRIEQATD